ncbi:Arylsulfatase [Salmonella enterica subsp. arizonae]|uniref:Arylsulfatase n=1 Tax=Salmonella enterica subsp. arizonae TaxID=59203 RepID=A0A379S8C1_SALER|nr:Arylsulfatase [Salmonella enterica subsp. arizonae]
MQPNILVFFTDQQRWDTVGCYNPAVSTTPVLDQLAREGVKFENAFTVQPVCGPGAFLPANRALPDAERLLSQ